MEVRRSDRMHWSCCHKPGLMQRDRVLSPHSLLDKSWDR